MGFILFIHVPSSNPNQSLFYHHTISNGIYLAERGFLALNVLMCIEKVDDKKCYSSL